MKRFWARTLVTSLVLSAVLVAGALASEPAPREAPDAEPPLSSPSLAALDIRLHPAGGDRLRPPATMRLTDFRGRTTGYDLQKAETVTCIPRSWYEEERIDDAESGAPGPRTLVLHLAAPEPGRYLLVVHGTDSGRYHLEIQATGRSLATSRAVREDVPVTAGTSHRYTLTTFDTPGAPIELTGPVAVAPPAR